MSRCSLVPLEAFAHPSERMIPDVAGSYSKTAMTAS